MEKKAEQILNRFPSFLFTETELDYIDGRELVKCAQKLLLNTSETPEHAADAACVCLIL